MKRVFGPALLGVALAASIAAGAQTAPSPAPAAPSTAPATAAPTPAATMPAPGATAPSGTIVPGSLSGSAGGTPVPGAAASPNPAPSAAAPAPQASPLPVASAPGRFHLHRPGTDVDGDLLTGNALSDVFIFHGNVVLRSDPKVDQVFRSTESDEPITITADEIDVDRAGLSYVAKGHVHFVQGSRSGRADTALLNEQTHDLDLLGNADVLDGEHRARAAKMHYNLADRRFHGAGDIRIYQPVPTPDPNVSPTPAPKRRRRLPL